MIIGADEVGRGAWAGPLVVCAVSLGKPIEGLADSKILTSAKRQKLAEKIQTIADFIGFGWAESSEIDEFGLSAAHYIAYRRAVRATPKESEIIIDGNINYLPGLKNSSCLVKADQLIPSVSAASILAKVARDNFMRELSTKFPSYGFENHVGYGTKQHIEAIARFGISGVHRKTYKPLLAYGSA